MYQGQIVIQESSIIVHQMFAIVVSVHLGHMKPTF